MGRLAAMLELSVRWSIVGLLAFPALPGVIRADGLAPEYLGVTPGVLADYFKPSHAADASSGRQPLNIASEGGSYWIYIFGASNGAGRYGSYFRTDIFLSGSGMGNGSITFDLWVLPANRNNSILDARRYSMPDNGIRSLTDIVGSFGFTGAATVLIHVIGSASTAIGNFTLLSAWGRTYTAGASGGSYSTTLPATTGWIVSSSSYSDTPGVVVSDLKRSNVGCFNHDSTPTTCTVTVYGTDGRNLGQISLSLPPFSSLQQSLTGYDMPEPGGDVLFSVSSGHATGYVVVNDNVTNDADLYLASYREYTACANIAGSWTGLFVDRCGNYGAGYVTIAQSGCSFTMASSIGTFSGTLYGNFGQFDISVSPSCNGSASGRFTVFSSQGISGTYSGQISGYGCCGPSLSGSFTLGR